MTRAASKQSQQESADPAASQPFRMPIVCDHPPAVQEDRAQGPIEFLKDHSGKWVILFALRSTRDAVVQVLARRTT